MKRWRVLVGLCALTLVAVLSVDTAEAFDGYYGGFGRGYFGRGYRGVVHPNHAAPPYFALNPPVYYGKVVPRDYGSSPFPYGPFARSQAPQRSRAANSRWAMSPIRGELVANPYFTQDDDAGVPSSPSDLPAVEAEATAQKRIRNPYFTEEDEVEKIAKK